MDIISNQWTCSTKVEKNLENFERKELDVFRYSHSAQIIDDFLWILGGMNASERRPPGLCRINLITGEANEYPIPVREIVLRYFCRILVFFRQCVANNRLYSIIIRRCFWTEQRFLYWVVEEIVFLLVG